MHAGDVAVFGTSEGLAVHGDGLPAVLHSGEDPAGQRGLEGGGVEAAEELAQATLGGAVKAGEAQRVPERQAMLFAELSDGLEALAAGQDGDNGERQDGGQGVASAFALAGVWDTCQRLDKGQTLHDFPSLGQLLTHRGGLPKPPLSTKINLDTALGRNAQSQAVVLPSGVAS